MKEIGSVLTGVQARKKIVFNLKCIDVGSSKRRKQQQPSYALWIGSNWFSVNEKLSDEKFSSPSHVFWETIFLFYIQERERAKGLFSSYNGCAYI